MSDIFIILCLISPLWIFGLLIFACTGPVNKFKIIYKTWIESEQQIKQYTVWGKHKYLKFWRKEYKFRTENQAQHYIKEELKRIKFGIKKETIYPNVLVDMSFKDPKDQELYEASIKSLNNIKQTLRTLESKI